MKTVGIIGGMGPLATSAFHRALVLNTAATCDQDHVPVILDSDPRIPDRTAFLLGSGPDPRPALIRSAARLAAAQAELLVMPCNTANVFKDEIEHAVGIPMVPWLSIAVGAVVDGRHERPDVCGLLATTGTLKAGVYRRLLQAQRVETIEPDGQDQESVMAAIYERDGVKATGAVSRARRDALQLAARHLVDRGAGVLLLACTELPLAIAADDAAWPRRTVDPAIAVARRTIELAGGTVAPVVVA